MIKKATIKNSTLFKGATLAFAGVLAFSFFPMSVIEAKADFVSDSFGSQSINIQNGQNKATKGSGYDIRAAYFGESAKIPMGLEDYTSITTGTSDTVAVKNSQVTVTYKPTGENIEVDKRKDGAISDSIKADAKNAVYGTVQMNYAGEYGINYSITLSINGGEEQTFSTEYIVTSEITTAYFEFDTNSKEVVPSVYDISMASKLEDKNLYLPIPKLFDRNEEEVEGLPVVINNDLTGVEDKTYVAISISGGDNKTIALQKNNDGKYFVEAKYFDETDAENFGGEGNYAIKYSYFLNGQFITSAVKNFKVSKSYYQDYELTLVKNSSVSSAITGVEVEVPTISGKTGSKTTPAGEAVNISYTVKAFRKVNSSYSETREDAIVDGKFTPWADGDYRLEYTAKDFYGNTQTIYQFIDGVKDTKKPVAKIYDASNKKNYVDEKYDGGIEEYIDASTALKSKTVENNIIIYAVGATDNVSKIENMKLTRVIKNSARTITIDKYADYNLIFNFSDAETLVQNNSYLKAKLDEAGVAGEENIKTWLKENKFLIVTNEKDKTVEEGYAYLDVKLTGGVMLPGSSSGTSYTVLYYAEDEAKNESSQLSYTISVVTGEFEDTINPEITFVTNLKSSYRTGSVIKFEKPTATDDTDTRMDVVTEYKYEGETEWRALKDGEYKIDLSEIDTALETGTRPKSLTIRVTTVDDYGNAGLWQKNISIADIEDNDVPVLIMEKYNTKNDQPISQKSEIVLPTIQVKDKNVNYINSEVYVARVALDGTRTEIKVRGKSENKDTLGGIYTLEAGKVIAAYAGDYEVKVVITDAGNNQITTFYTYKVKGSAVLEDPIITGLGAVLGEDGKGEVGQAIDLPTPTVDYKLDGEGYDIFGVTNKEGDTSKAAFDYDVKVTNNAPSSYKFNENEENTFTAYEAGVYELQYTVRVSVFNKEVFEVNADGTAVIEKGTTNEVKELANGDLVLFSKSEKSVKYAKLGKTEFTVYDISSVFSGINNYGTYVTVGGKNYFLKVNGALELISRDGQAAEFSLTTNGSDEGIVTIGGTETNVGKGTALYLNAFKTYAPTSDVLKVDISDTKKPEILTDYDYPTTAPKGYELRIKPVEAKDLSATGINKSKSYVLLEYKGGDASFSTQWNLDKWEADDKSTNEIIYKLTSEGNYTLTYYVSDYAGNVNSDKSYKIAVGDCVEPELTLDKGFVAKEKFELGETLTLDFNKITFKDNKTSVDALKETVKIKVTNTSTNDEVENTIENGDEEHRYSYKLDKAGTYKVEVSVTDQAGWTTTKTVEFEVSTEADKGTEVTKIVGTVLIVLAALVLVGVIAYFVISKIKKDKKGKGKKADKKKSDKIVK